MTHFQLLYELYIHCILYDIQIIRFLVPSECKIGVFIIRLGLAEILTKKKLKCNDFKQKEINQNRFANCQRLCRRNKYNHWENQTVHSRDECSGLFFPVECHHWNRGNTQNNFRMDLFHLEQQNKSPVGLLIDQS